jgi:hypothetical protein
VPLVEDSLGWPEARCWPVRVAPGARIYEISGPAEWGVLVRRYPLEVSKSRRHDWWRATGWAGRWLIPDFTAVASDYDAVHVTVRAYLTTAGKALPVGAGETVGGPRVDEARTVLAGWDPDQTYWLADVLASSALRPAGWKARTNHSAGSRPGDQAVGPSPSPTRAGRSSPGRPILLGQASGRGIGVAAEVCWWPWLSPGPFLVPWLTAGDCDLPPRTVDTVTS